MNIESQIKQIVESAIPLDPMCERKRKEQINQRIQLRLEFEELARKLMLQAYEPRTQLK